MYEYLKHIAQQISTKYGKSIFNGGNWVLKIRITGLLI